MFNVIALPPNLYFPLLFPSPDAVGSSDLTLGNIYRMSRCIRAMQMTDGLVSLT